MNTVVGEVDAKNAVELRYVNTVVIEVDAKNAVELRYMRPMGRFPRDPESGK